MLKGPLVGRPPEENRSKLIEDLQRQEAERHVDPVRK